jgi:hypothetical protein
MRSADDFDAIRARITEIRRGSGSSDHHGETLLSTQCHSHIFDPDRQVLVPISYPQHKFSLSTQRCVYCNLCHHDLSRGS